MNRLTEAACITDGFTTTSRCRGLVPRHGGGLVVGFLDGHARWMTRDQINEVVEGEPGSYSPGGYYYRYISADW